MMISQPHLNVGSSGSFRTVLELLNEHPEGLTSSQILELATSRGLFEDAPSEESKTLYFRVKRALESLEKLGYIRQDGHLPGDTRQRVYVAIPEAIDSAMREALRKSLEDAKARLEKQLKQFPQQDAAQLLAAFDGVLTEEALGSGAGPRKPQIGSAALKIRKKT